MTMETTIFAKIFPISWREICAAAMLSEHALLEVFRREVRPYDCEIIILAVVIVVVHCVATLLALYG